MDIKTGDVYIILNKSNKKVLVGEGKDGKSRLRKHLYDLKRGEERNRNLQQDFLSFGENQFLFKVIIEGSGFRQICQAILIELFSRVDQEYNIRDKNGALVSGMEEGLISIPPELFQEIEAFIEQSKEELPYYKELLIELDDIEINSFESKSEKMFQREFKKSYLRKKYHNKETVRVMKELFKKSYDYELKKGKDLYDFTKKEAEEFLISLGKTTTNNIRNIKSSLSNYLDFAIESGDSNNLKNYYREIDNNIGQDTIFDKKEVMAIAEEADNAQDGVILALLFEGVSHRNGFEELINLTEDDIDFEDNKIQFVNREIPITRETSVLIKKALTDTHYISIKGEKIRNYEIGGGNHILRGLRNKSIVNGQIISQRIIRIAKKFGYDSLSATNVANSGQVHYTKLLLNRHVQEDEAIGKVLKRFDMPINTSSRWYLKNKIRNYSEQ